MAQCLVKHMDNFTFTSPPIPSWCGAQEQGQPYLFTKMSSGTTFPV